MTLSTATRIGAALATVPLITASAAYAGTCGGGGTTPISANVTGTGKVIANGQAAWVDFAISCPKGETWSVDESAGFNFVATDGDQAPGRLEPMTGKCASKEQIVKLKFVPFFETVGPGCGDYSMTFVIAGQEIFLSWSPGVDEVTGPPVCLTETRKPVPSPSPAP